VKHTVTVSLLFHTAILFLIAMVMFYGGMQFRNTALIAVLAVIAVTITIFTIRNIMRSVHENLKVVSSDLKTTADDLTAQKKELKLYADSLSHYSNEISRLVATIDASREGVATAEDAAQTEWNPDSQKQNQPTSNTRGI
jgi:methyl-accepting chemotaxis protein